MSKILLWFSQHLLSQFFSHISSYTNWKYSNSCTLGDFKFFTNTASIDYFILFVKLVAE
ncbi:hypothetical protein WP2S18C03_19330 [Aeromonas veronii]|nr:hypothetical protein WP2S18C03_19330 [Aeromonas veronii]